jgi:hypothetical protein
MTPTILFSHVPFGKNLEAIRTHAASRHYAGVEWNLEQTRRMIDAWLASRVESA